MQVEMTPEAVGHIVDVANGDARSALNAVELAVLTTHPDKDGVIRIDLSIAEESIQHRAVRCDEEEYYNMLSAFCKMCIRDRMYTEEIDKGRAFLIFTLAFATVVHGITDITIFWPQTFLLLAFVLSSVGIYERKPAVVWDLDVYKRQPIGRTTAGTPPF